VLHLVALGLKRIPDGWRSNQRMNQGLGRVLAYVGKRAWTKCSLNRTRLDDHCSVKRAQPKVREVAEGVVNFNVKAARLWYDSQAVATIERTDGLVRYPSFFREHCRNLTRSWAI
jgi:hypothetical protein